MLGEEKQEMTSLPLRLGMEVGRTPGFSVVFIPLLHLSSLSVLYLAGSFSIFLSGEGAGTSPASTKVCCCYSVPKLCRTLCDPMDCSRPGFPVLHYLPEFAQTHVH